MLHLSHHLTLRISCCSSQFATHFGEISPTGRNVLDHSNALCSAQCGDTTNIQGHTVQCQGDSHFPCSGRKVGSSHKRKLKGMFIAFLYKRLPKGTCLYPWQCGSFPQRSLPTAGCCPLRGASSRAGFMPQPSQLTARQLGIKRVASPVLRGWSMSWVVRSGHPCWEDGSLQI